MRRPSMLSLSLALKFSAGTSRLVESRSGSGRTWPTAAGRSLRRCAPWGRPGQAGGKGDHAVAAGAAIGGLDAGDAAERGGLADGAAGVGAGGRRAPGAATATALPPDEPPGMRVGGPGVCARGGASKPTGANAEFSLAEPMANSSRLSLPRSRRRFGQLGDHGGVKRRLVARQHLASRRCWGSRRVTKMSLCAIGTPSSAAVPAAMAGVGARAWARVASSFRAT